jgi:hypothetical protein
MTSYNAAIMPRTPIAPATWTSKPAVGRATPLLKRILDAAPLIELEEPADASAALVVVVITLDGDETEPDKVVMAVIAVVSAVAAGGALFAVTLIPVPPAKVPVTPVIVISTLLDPVLSADPAVSWARPNALKIMSSSSCASTTADVRRA